MMFGKKKSGERYFYATFEVVDYHTSATIKKGFQYFSHEGMPNLGWVVSTIRRFNHVQNASNNRVIVTYIHEFESKEDFETFKA